MHAVSSVSGYIPGSIMASYLQLLQASGCMDT